MDADVIVVGAGAAGLAAALRLAERSVHTIVLEGKARVGGRVLWNSLGSGNEQVELGAEFIHGAAPETSALLREAGLGSVATSDAAWVRDDRGELRPADDEFGPSTIFETVPSLDVDESVDTFLRRFERDPRKCEAARQARAFVEGFEAAEPARASVRAVAAEIATGIDATSARPIGGYAPLFDYVVDRCTQVGVDLRLNTSVERIVWQPGRVEIEASCASGGPVRLRTRCVIVTVSVGVLQQRGAATPLRFVPPLPAQQASALNGLEMGRVVRAELAFRTPVWEELAAGRYRDAAWFRAEGSAFGAFWTQLPTRSRAIAAWAGGPRATALDALTVDERIERARDEFAQLFGERDRERVLADYAGGATHDWSADPFACGAYSYVVVGAGEARAALAAPIAETVFLAGEATARSGQSGTVSGAFESGGRAASEALIALGRLRESRRSR